MKKEKFNTSLERDTFLDHANSDGYQNNLLDEDDDDYN